MILEDMKNQKSSMVEYRMEQKKYLLSSQHAVAQKEYQEKI